MKKLRCMAVVLFALIGVILSYSIAMAEEFPAKPITLVIPYTAGGSTDLTIRALADAAKPYLGQPVICENKVGGGGTVGPNYVITKPPDGYTIGAITSAATIAMHMGKISFNPIEDLTHIMRWGGYLFGIVVRTDSQWKTIQDFLEYAKANPEKISYACGGLGIPPNLAMEELGLVAGIKWVFIPTKGIAESNVMLLGSHVESISDSSGWAPLVDSGKFRLLATYGYQRATRYPQVPTIKEIGYNVVCPGPIGLMGPKGMPKPIVKKIHDAFKKAMDNPEFLSIMEKLDMPLLYQNSEDYEKFVREDSERVGNLVKRLGMQKK